MELKNNIHKLWDQIGKPKKITVERDVKIGLNDVMTFGEYKGTKFSELGAGYQYWLKTSFKNPELAFNEDVIKYLEDIPLKRGRHVPGSNCSMFD